MPAMNEFVDLIRNFVDNLEYNCNDLHNNKYLARIDRTRSLLDFDKIVFSNGVIKNIISQIFLNTVIF